MLVIAGGESGVSLVIEATRLIQGSHFRTKVGRNRLSRRRRRRRRLWVDSRN